MKDLIVSRNEELEFALKAFRGSNHKKHQFYEDAADISRILLKDLGYTYMRTSWHRYRRTPGIIVGMARDGYVRLHLATPTAHHHYQETEVWYKRGA